MEDARLARGYEQHEFIRRQAEHIRLAAKQSDNYQHFILDFVIALFGELRAPKGLQYPEDIDLDRLLKGILIFIEGFARVESEKRYLLYLLFEQLQPSIRDWASLDYLREQFANPEKVFGAPSATTEVKSP